jgi:hypothetical protein
MFVRRDENEKGKEERGKKMDKKNERERKGTRERENVVQNNDEKTRIISKVVNERITKSKTQNPK